LQQDEFAEPPETDQTRALSAQRLAFVRAMEAETPHHGVTYSTPDYFEVGRSDLRFLIWDPSAGHQQSGILICQSFDGKEGRTVFKQPLQKLGKGNASVPHTGTLARIIFAQGFEVAKPCPPNVAEWLDKSAAYAGYAPSLPSDQLTTWIVSPNGEASKVEVFAVKSSGNTAWMWYPISRAERGLLGW
jgi:hypothetical protein